MTAFFITATVVLGALFVVVPLLGQKPREISVNNRNFQQALLRTTDTRGQSSLLLPARADAQDEGALFLQKIKEAREMIHETKLAVGERIVSFNDIVSGKQRKFQDADMKEIALVLFNESTKDLMQVIIEKRGKELINKDDRFHIVIEERINGIGWNSFNTAFRVQEPSSGWTVILVRYPVAIIRQGRIEEVITVDYVPYNSALYRSSFVRLGEQYLNNITRDALNELFSLKVPSHAFSEKNIEYLEKIPGFYSFLSDIIFVEHTDPWEFSYLGSDLLKNRILVILGLNQSHAFRFTESSANARGLAQFTGATYAYLQRQYPLASLLPNFNEGAANHVNIMKAQILLHDDNLRQLKEVFGDEIVEDPRLFEYLAAAYNGGVSRVKRSLQDARIYRRKDWTRKLRLETRLYIEKLRALRLL